MRTAININQTGIFLRGIHVGRGDEAAPERVAFFVEDGEYLGGAQRAISVRVLAILEFFHRFALVVHHADDTRCADIGEIIDEIVLAFIENWRVRAVGGRDADNLAIFQG